MHYDNRPICWHKWCLCWFIWCICHFYRFDAVIKMISISSWICAPKTDNTKEGSCNENQLDALVILCLFHQLNCTCFRHICSSSSGSILYTYNWYMFFLVDCLLAQPTDSQAVKQFRLALKRFIISNSFYSLEEYFDINWKWVLFCYTGYTAPCKMACWLLILILSLY
jgi:hypothetical protein